MSVNLQPSVTIARWYDEGQSFELKSPYRAICSIMHLTDTEVFIFGMHGTLSKTDMAELFIELRSRGIETVTAERKGQLTRRNIIKLLERANLPLDNTPTTDVVE